ncbi:2021_t:CDS:2, partial [Ambispora gerdemannii]
MYTCNYKESDRARLSAIRFYDLGSTFASVFFKSQSDFSDDDGSSSSNYNDKGDAVMTVIK